MTHKNVKQLEVKRIKIKLCAYKNQDENADMEFTTIFTCEHESMNKTLKANSWVLKGQKLKHHTCLISFFLLNKNKNKIHETCITINLRKVPARKRWKKKARSK